MGIYPVDNIIPEPSNNVLGQSNRLMNADNLLKKEKTFQRNFKVHNLLWTGIKKE